MSEASAPVSASAASPLGVRGVDAVFVLGAGRSGGDLVHAVLCRLGLRPLGDGGPSPEVLVRCNERLLERLGGSTETLPEVAPADAAHALSASAVDARSCFEDVDAPPPGAGCDPWVWADPPNSLLGLFWAQALGVRPCAVLVHRHPASLAAAAPAGSDPHILDRWADYNRAAMVHCSLWPSLVLGYEDMLARPKESVNEVAEFLEACGVGPVSGLDEAVELLERLAAEHEAATPGTGDVDPAPGGADAVVGSAHAVLARVLGELDGPHLGAGTGDGYDVAGIMDAVSGFYGADYYGTSYDHSGVPYRRGEKLWEDVFASMADLIVERLHPGTVLDAGCATGMLVEALRIRGVDARGFDISQWAVGQVPPSLRPFCRVGSITDEIEGHYDLITCLEVLEHLPPALAEASVANLCRHADAVLFSSTPDDFDEPTHLNVEPGAYWAQLFFRHGFVRDVDVDVSFVAHHAMVLRRGRLDTEAIIAEYERGWWHDASSLRAQLHTVIDEHERLVERYHEVVDLPAEVERLRAELGDLRLRRSAEAVAASEVVRQLEANERRLAGLVESRQAELDAIRATKTFRYTTSLRELYGRTRRPSGPPSPVVVAPEQPAGGSYRLWVEQFDTIDDAARDAIGSRLAGLAYRPTISVVMPVYDPPADLLAAAIDSVRGQLYPHWELCIADDCSPAPHVAEILASYAALDDRIKVRRRDANGHIAAASNTALSMATGEFVACLDHDDVLAEHALALVAEAVVAHPEVGMVYSDEDKLDGSGARCDPYFKPDFDPLLLLGQNFVSHLSAFRRDLVTAVGGYREGYEGSQDWDLTLRVAEHLRPDQVVHIPHVLYHWRAHAGSTAAVVSAKPYAVDAGRRAVTDHLARTGRAGRVTRIGRSGHNRVTWDVPDPAPVVSIIIPTRDGRLLQRCIDSVLSLTTYPSFELLVVDNASRTLPILDYLRANDDRVVVMRDENAFNYAALNNNAVRRASGELVCLLNDDTEVIAADWLSEMVGQVLQPGVGAVGAKLYYDDGRIQHAGVVTGVYGVAGHAHRLFDRLSPGYFGQLQLAHAMSAVTAACTVVRRQAWDEVEGLDGTNLPVAFNDVDFCLRLRRAGWSVVWTPYAELFHHESVSRGPDDTGPRAAEFQREVDYMQRRWGPATLRRDPFYNPNLSLDAEDFSLAWPPRVSYR